MAVRGVRPTDKKQVENLLSYYSMPAKKRIPVWIYLVLAIFCLAPMVAVVVIKKYNEKMAAAARAATAPAPFNTIRYQGQTIQLSKTYANFEQYKNDPNNIAVSETARVHKLVTQAHVRVSYHVNDGLDDLISELGFPGYRVRKLETSSMPEMSAAFAIEIPRANQDRVILFRYQLQGARWVLIDDFVGPPGVMDVRLKGGELQFYTLDGQLLARHPQPP